MSLSLDTIHQGDCLELMGRLPEGSVDLAFADPPFNIGYKYDVYEDELADQQYLQWSSEWMSAVHRVLKPNGTFWLAIGDEYAAELKVECRKIGFHCRSWVIWYYTFGVNCAKKFTRSHAHLFYFVKDPASFTFRDEDLENRVPSARELVYNDKRANPKGRLPDDTWIIRPADAIGAMTPEDEHWIPEAIEPPADNDRTFTLRPQDLEHCFSPGEDTWYFPRVAGTFKERAGFHGCQMPEQLLGRIIRSCSNEGDLVLDPFSGSATTLAVAKKLGRRYIGCELSSDYVQYGSKRLDAIRVGDRLDGSAEPTKSAPKTDRSKRTKSRGAVSATVPVSDGAEQLLVERQQKLTELGVREAYQRSHAGYSPDRVVADPDLNRQFFEECVHLGLAGDARMWNTLLFRLRKRGALSDIPTTNYTETTWDDCDRFLFASEIAMQRMINDGLAETLDEILCDPELAADFDERAKRLAPGFTSFEYRWTALRLRKEAKTARTRGAILRESRSGKFEESIPLENFDAESAPLECGVYVVSDENEERLYVGESANLRERLQTQFGVQSNENWVEYGDGLSVLIRQLDTRTPGRLAWQSCLARKYRPRLNYAELWTA